MRVPAYAAPTAGAPLAPFTIDRRDPGPRDVAIDALFCGVCHSDVHQARDEWGGGLFPMVPGHEIVGRVIRVGREVTRFKAGDLVGVGCMVDSCGRCEQCRAGTEQFCVEGGALSRRWPRGADEIRRAAVRGGTRDISRARGPRVPRRFRPRPGWSRRCC